MLLLFTWGSAYCPHIYIYFPIFILISFIKQKRGECFEYVRILLENVLASYQIDIAAILCQKYILSPNITISHSYKRICIVYQATYYDDIS